MDHLYLQDTQIVSSADWWCRGVSRCLATPAIIQFEITIRAKIKSRVGGAVISIGLALVPRRAQHFDGSLFPLPPSSFHFPLPFLFLYFRLAQLVVCAIPYEKKSCRLCSTLAKGAISIYYGARQLLAIIYGMCIASLATSYSSFYCWLHNAHIISDASHIKHVSSLSPSLFLYSDSTGFVSSWSSVIQDIW